MIPLILSVALVLMLLADVIVGTRRTRRAMAAVEAVPAFRVRLYRILIAAGWIRAAAAVVVMVSAGLSLTEIGVSGPGGGPVGGLPDGGTLAWPAAVALTLSVGIGGVRARRRMRAGHIHPQRAKIATLIPRTATERRYAGALSVTAGITEEIVFRGALIALGIEVFHLPVLASAALSLVLFAALHAYQGRVGLLSSGFLGLVFTGLTLAGGSVLPAMVMHIAVDLVALLVVPAEATARPAEPAEPAEKPEPTPVDTPPPPAVPTIRSPTPAG